MDDAYNQQVLEARRNLPAIGRGDMLDTSNPHDKLLDMLRRVKTTACNALSSKVDNMRRMDEIYHLYRVPDKDDKKAAERGEPMKIIIPVTYAQIQTMLSLCMQLLDRDPFFSLSANQPQFVRGSKLMEIELDYQLEQAGWTLLLYQWLMDTFKYGFGAIHTGYEKQMVYVRKNVPIPILGALFPGMTMEQDLPVVGFEGAAFEVQDPYNFKYDPSVSVGNIQKGSYVFHSWRRSYNELLLRQSQGEFFNVERIPERTGLQLGKTTDRGRERDFYNDDAKNAISTGKVEVKGSDPVKLDTMYVKLVPSQYKLSSLGQMQIWKITMANDAVIIQAEPSKFEHGQFPISVCEYNPDIHELANDGTAEVIDGLQMWVNWLLNTRMNAVKKSLNQTLLINPGAFEVEDLVSRKPIIRMKAGAVGDISRHFATIPTQDVTQVHEAFAASAYQWIERATGASDNMAGQTSNKVFSATEIANTQRLGMGRMGLFVMLAWTQGIREVGKQMIQNTQTFCKSPRFYEVTGGMAQALGLTAQEMEQGLQVDAEQLAGFYRVKMINPRTQNDKLMRANSLKELLGMAMSNPMAIPLLGLNPSQLLTQMLLDSGIRNTTDFVRPPNPDLVQQLLVLMTQVQKGGFKGTPGNGAGVQAQVMPDEEVIRQQQAGNIVPDTGAANVRL